MAKLRKKSDIQGSVLSISLNLANFAVVKALVVKNTGSWYVARLEDGSLLASWTSENARAVRGAALASSGVLALLAGPADSPELVMSEPVTGETLLRIPGLPAGAYALAH